MDFNCGFMSTDKARYNIIVSDDSGYSLDSLSRLDLDQLGKVIRIGGKYSWTLQTYHHLRNRGIAVKLSQALDPDCVNIAHVNVLREMNKHWTYFNVSIQGDFPHYPLAHHHIVQNHDQVKTHSSFMPLWPQVGQIPRDRKRMGVRTVAFQGRITFTDLDPDRLNADLNPHGIEFKSLDNWQDLSAVDVLVGIRYYGRKRYHRKPASKLVNAWHARIPFVGGWDSAYAHLGTPGKDYLRVATHEELVDAILDLKRDSVLYEQLVDAGSVSAEQYTTESITQMWIDLLEGKLHPMFTVWKSKPNTAMLEYMRKRSAYNVSSTIKRLMRMTYRVPVIKRFRDLYYDPVN